MVVTRAAYEAELEAERAAHAAAVSAWRSGAELAAKLAAELAAEREDAATSAEERRVEEARAAELAMGALRDDHAAALAAALDSARHKLDEVHKAALGEVEEAHAETGRARGEAAAAAGAAADAARGGLARLAAEARAEHEAVRAASAELLQASREETRAVAEAGAVEAAALRSAVGRAPPSGHILMSHYDDGFMNISPPRGYHLSSNVMWVAVGV